MEQDAPISPDTSMENSALTIEIKALPSQQVHSTLHGQG